MTPGGLMDQQGPQLGYWTNMVVHRPVMETSGVRNPTAALSGSPDDPTQMVTPASGERDTLLDGEKTGATLLFSGVFLVIVGVTFTVSGWQRYLTNSTFEWSQFLGPIMIAVGGTFMLTSICKLGFISCWPYRQEDEEVPAIPVVEQTSTGRPFTLNQPVMLCGATTMFCVPPAYNFRNPEVHQGIEFQPGGSMNGVQAAVPAYDSVYSVDNAAFTAEEEEEDSPARSTETDSRRSRTEKTEDERGREDDSGSNCSHPPAYEDIFPSFSKHNLT